MHRRHGVGVDGTVLATHHLSIGALRLPHMADDLGAVAAAAPRTLAQLLGRDRGHIVERPPRRVHERRDPLPGSRVGRQAVGVRHDRRGTVGGRRVPRAPLDHLKRRSSVKRLAREGGHRRVPRQRRRERLEGTDLVAAGARQAGPVQCGRECLLGSGLEEDADGGH